MNPSLFLLQAGALISPVLGLCIALYQVMKGFFLLFPFFVFKEQQRGGAFPDQRVHSQKQVAEEVNMGGQRQLKKLRLSLSEMLNFFPPQ